jgi:molybdopterin/thiamine biosynthesis adenylyltransferase
MRTPGWLSLTSVAIEVALRRPSSAASCQARLRQSHVGVLGLGALGGKIVELLAAAGLGAITAIDGDVVELSNLNRQTLYTEMDIGRAKADVARERIGALNSRVEFDAQRGWLRSQTDVESVIAHVDFVVDAVDSPPHEIERWVNGACFARGVPYIAMSHYPPQIRVGPTYVPDETGCYRCQETAWRIDDPLFDCVPAHWRPAALGGTAAAVAGFAAMEVTSYLTGLSTPVTLGSALILDLTSGALRRSPVVQADGCPVCRTAR